MVFKWMRFIILLLICGTVFFIGNYGLPFLVESSLPPFGKLINPHTGFWQNDSSTNDLEETEVFPALQEEVNLFYDERQVPHIFAQNDHDLYYTYGYITAKNRFWQMDFMSRVAGGNLSDAVGAKAIEFDKFNRKIGLLEAAEKSVEALKEHPKAYQMLLAYVDGVNKYVKELEPQDYPVEFKLINYKPEEWTAVKSALVLKYLAWDLDGSTDDRFVTNAKKVYSDSLFQAFYPLENPYYEPIVKPSFVSKKKQSSQTFHYDRFGNKVYTPSLRYLVQPSEQHYLPTQSEDYTYHKGSNNWAVRGSKTRSGNPILANDPHLSLSLPSLWYEAQLSNGSDLNVYGVSVPGIPFVILGFNKDAAIGFTYTTSDVVDFAKVQLNKDKSQYLLDGKWANPRIRIDTIEVKNAEPIIERTIITAVGPIIYTDSLKRTSFNKRIPAENVAMNWVGQQASNEFVSGYYINRATTISEYQQALEYFNSPGQNMLFATKNNSIAITHNGKFPNRNANQARFVADSVTSQLIWKNYIPRKALPKVVNPARGYILSANQPPIKGYSTYYYGADDYASFERANRIQEVLDSIDTITPYDFQKLQLDNYSLLAEKLLPHLIQQLNEQNLSIEQKDALNELKSWNYQYNATSKSPIIFNTWVEQLKKAIFLDEANNPKQLEFLLPRDDVMAKTLLTDSIHIVYDNVKTPTIIETQQDIVKQSFEKSIDSLQEKYGSLNDSWKWGSVNPTNIPSLAKIAGFGIENLHTGGSKRSVNAISGNNGPSWRMIVELDKERPKAYGVYPGGQSGHPGSPHYDDFVNDWANGEYYELNYMLNQQDNQSIIETIKLKPE